MDLETENAIARLLMKEAAELRRQAEKDGVSAYLRKPNVRGRPNSRFLTATVLGVQQSNRLVEVNEMWKVREKEKELDERIRGRSSDDSSSSRSHRDRGDFQKSTHKRRDRDEATDSGPYSTIKKDMREPGLGEAEGFKDDDIDEFLHSRAKRGRGAVGSRMDETGPYLATYEESRGKHLANSDVGDDRRWGQRVVLGPGKPRSLKPSDSESSEEDGESVHVKRKKSDKVSSSSKRHSRKHQSSSKEKSKDKKKHRDKKSKGKRYK